MNKRLVIVNTALLALILCVCFAVSRYPTDSGVAVVSLDKEARFLECRYFIKTDFDRHTARAVIYESGPLRAGVVPHHLLAGELIASFFKTARDKGGDIGTVVVIGPNHQGLGADISTADCGWNTRLGAVSCDNDLVGKMLSYAALGVRVDNELLETDHAASDLIPYIKYYLPDAKVVALLLTRRVTLAQTEDLADFLAAQSKDKNILVVGSVDFSHGLSVEEGQVRDQKTLAAIDHNDFESIKKMSNEHLDSPEALCTVLNYMRAGGGGKPVLLSHSNAAEFLGTPQLNDGTTYFVFGSP